jgi:hypothetical protein
MTAGQEHHLVSTRPKVASLLGIEDGMKPADD